jgi:hypothetical protein
MIANCCPSAGYTVIDIMSRTACFVGPFSFEARSRKYILINILDHRDNQTRISLHNIPPIDFYPSQRHVQQGCGCKSNLKPNIAGRTGNRSNKPCLVHRWNDQSKRCNSSCQGRDPCGKFARLVPCLPVVLLCVVLPEKKMLQNDDGCISAGPVAYETEEIDKCLVEFMCANNGDRDHTAMG